MLNSITPFFIVDDLAATIEFYQTKLGFEVKCKGGDGIGPDFWAFVARDQVMVMFKYIAPEIHPQPNHSRHGAALGCLHLRHRPGRSIRRVRLQRRPHPPRTRRHQRRPAGLRDHR